jgi:hypothetical protein
MGPLAVRRHLRRLRRHAAAVLLVLSLGGAVAVAHAQPAMGGMHDDMAMTPLQVCAGVFSAVGATVVAVCLGLIALGRWPTPPVLVAGALRAASGAPCPRARAGPPRLLLVCVWRR